MADWSGLTAIVAAGIAVWGQIRIHRQAAKIESIRLAEQRRIEASRTAAHYREPLARAAYDLQSRIYNILQQGLLAAYYDRGTERERTYVVENTSFLIAQYFAWVEIIRRDIQYIDLGQDGQTRQLTYLQDGITGLFLTDRFEPRLRVFAGDQRAIGERLIKEGRQGLECMGYGAYLDLVIKDGNPIIASLRDDVKGLSSSLSEARPRLVAIQHALIDLLQFLDADFIRFPKNHRSKVPAVAN